MNASNFVEGVDFSLYMIMGISLVFLVGITVVMVYFLFKYSRKNNPVATNITHNNTLEVVWTVIPTILVIMMFWYGWTGYKPMLTAPEGALEINAVGQMWKWSFEYPDGKVTDSLVVPIDEPIKLNLISKDVNHSLYIPAFRIKQDVVQDAGNMMWFSIQGWNDPEDYWMSAKNWQSPEKPIDSQIENWTYFHTNYVNNF